MLFCDWSKKSIAEETSHPLDKNKRKQNMNNNQMKFWSLSQFDFLLFSFQYIIWIFFGWRKGRQFVGQTDRRTANISVCIHPSACKCLSINSMHTFCKRNNLWQHWHSIRNDTYTYSCKVVASAVIHVNHLTLVISLLFIHCRDNFRQKDELTKDDFVWHERGCTKRKYWFLGNGMLDKFRLR